MNKKEIFNAHIAHREQEVFDYQVNIDNYRIAIDLAKQDPDLSAFVEQLENLLRTSIIEQKKSKIMLEVAKKQIKELEDVSTN